MGIFTKVISPWVVNEIPRLQQYWKLLRAAIFPLAPVNALVIEAGGYTRSTEWTLCKLPHAYIIEKNPDRKTSAARAWRRIFAWKSIHFFPSSCISSRRRTSHEKQQEKNSNQQKTGSTTQQKGWTVTSLLGDACTFREKGFAVVSVPPRVCYRFGNLKEKILLSFSRCCRQYVILNLILYYYITPKHLIFNKVKM